MKDADLVVVDTSRVEVKGSGDDVQRRVSLLKTFIGELRAYETNGSRDQRSSISRAVVAVKSLLLEAGCLRTLTLTVRGRQAQTFDPFTSLFEVFDDVSPIPHVIDMVEEAIGVIESPGHLGQLTSKNESEVSVLARGVQRVEHLCRRFPQIARQLQSRPRKRSPIKINDEYDVQDLFHALLRLDFDDVRDEEWTPSYAGKSARVDFLLKPEKIVIEVKKTRVGLTKKEVGDQLLIDIGRYKVHPDCRTLVCFVYDPEHRIGNPHGLEADLSRTHDGLDVRVVIAPSDK